VDFVFSPYGTPLTLEASKVSERLKKVMLACAASGEQIWERQYKHESAITQTKSLIESAAGGILAIEIETKKFKYANPAICRILGYNEKEFEQMTLLDIPPRDKLQSVISQLLTKLGYSETDRVKEAHNLGASQYVRKPYSLNKKGLAVRAELQKQPFQHPTTNTPV
jgi:PAS domain S-box-containing protein